MQPAAQKFITLKFRYKNWYFVRKKNISFLFLK